METDCFGGPLCYWSDQKLIPPMQRDRVMLGYSDMIFQLAMQLVAAANNHSVLDITQAYNGPQVPTQSELQYRPDK